MRAKGHDLTGATAGGAGLRKIDAAPGMSRLAWLTPTKVVVAILTLLALGLRAYRLLRPGLLAVTQYDDGPYFGGAVRLVHGAVPYRDFLLVHPPGIAVLMTPVALASYVTGTAWALASARILTVLAATAAVPLAAILVRHRGLPAVFITCGILAGYPPSVASAHTVMLEPWLVLFCLVGAVATFEGDHLASTRRMVWGGAAFGFAGAVKAWAVVPVIVIVVLCLPRLRRAGAFAAGAAAGFGVPVLPFFALAPSNFYDGVVKAQLARVTGRVPTWMRIPDLIGIHALQSAPHAGILIAGIGVAAFVAGAHAAAAWASGRLPPTLDWFAVLTAGLVVVMLLWPPYFSLHYAAFLGPFLALAVGLPLARLSQIRRPSPPAPGRPGAAARAISSAAILTGLTLVGAELFQGLTAGHVGDGHGRLTTAAQRAIPPGACVLSDQVSYLLAADRFVSSVPSCPQMVDSLGTDLALSGGRTPASGAARFPAVRAVWRTSFGHAQYVLLSTHSSLRIPWTPALVTYFQDNFQRVLRTRSYSVYERRKARGQPGGA